MENKTINMCIEDTRFAGMKIFDGVENGKLYCSPTPFVKYFYKLGKNESEGQIEICENGFHFCGTLADASVFKHLFVSYKEISNAKIMRPVSHVITCPDSEIIESYSCSTLKFVTNKLDICSPRANFSVINDYIVSFYHSLSLDNQIIDKKGKTIICDCFDSIYFHTATDSIIEIPNTIERNSTIFSDVDSNLEVINKSKHTQYINRYDTYTQTIIAVPRKSKIKLNGGETISNPLFQVSYKLSQL